DLTELSHYALGHPFVAVTGDDVPDLVPDHRGDLRVGLGHLEKPGVDANLPARKREGVDLITLKNHDLPFGGGNGGIRHGEERLSEALDIPVHRGILTRWSLAFDLLEGLRPQ